MAVGFWRCQHRCIWITWTKAFWADVKDSTYESGVDPIGSARKRFNIRFYILAMTFLVFDIEIIFLYPWAVDFSQLAQGSEEATLFLGRILFFLGTSIVAYIYAWKKGVFNWD